jgi:hypothetical protein
MVTLDPVKPGETFSFYLDILIDGVPDSTVDASQFMSKVRSRDQAVIAVLDVTNNPGTPGRVTFRAAPSVTATWPIGTAYCDVKRTVSGDVMFTETFKIPVQRPETR